MPIIKDPKMNPNGEADFGVLFDESADEFYLYYKGSLSDPSNPKRYFIAGTEVEYMPGTNPRYLNKKKYKHTDGFFTTKVHEWVEIKDTPSGNTGAVIAAINTEIKGKKLPFPGNGERLTSYADIS